MLLFFCLCIECILVGHENYMKERLKSSLKNVYGRNGDLIKQYEVPIDLTNVELHSGAWPCTIIPSISQTFNHGMTFLTNMIFYRNASGFVGRFHLVLKYVQ